MHNSNIYLKSPFDNNTVFYLDKIKNAQDIISKLEYETIKMSVKKRRREFVAGRTLTRKALSQFEINNYDLLQGNNREPLWPHNIIGSISHSDTYVSVAVTNNENYRSIGVDLEIIEKIDDSQLNIILTKNEIDYLLHVEDKDIFHKIIFSAKESIYKCIYPIVKNFIDFSQVEIKVENNLIKIDNLHDMDNVNISNVKIGYIIFNDHIFTYCIYEK